MDNSAQIHVFEVIIVASMLFMSLYFVRSFDVSLNISKTEENEFEIFGNGILTNLEGIPDNLEKYPSLLARYATREYINEFTDYVNRSLPEGTLYEISSINISYLNKYPHTPIGKDPPTTPLYSAPVEIGKEASSSRIVVINGFVYEVVLTMYFTLR